jgi:hypothetical protein
MRMRVTDVMCISVRTGIILIQCLYARIAVLYTVYRRKQLCSYYIIQPTVR